MAHLRRSKIFILVSFFVVGLTVESCKQRKSGTGSLQSDNDPNSDAALEPYRVIDCTVELCGANNESLLALAQNPSDQSIAKDMKDTDTTEQYALDDTKPSGQGTKSNTLGALALEKATSLVSMANEAFMSLQGNKSPTTQLGVTSLLSALGPLLQSVNDAKKFATQQIDGASDDQRIQTLNQLRSLSNDMAKYASLGANNRDQMLSSLEVLAGQDGWLNYGDQPRITAVVPQIVGRIADQRIANETPGIIAQNSAIYRAKLPFGGFFGGRIVDRKVEQTVMSAAYGEKWQAVNDASTKIQTEYNKLMSELGVQNYYLLAQNTAVRYWDPAPQVSEAQMSAVVESLSGKKMDQLIADYSKSKTAGRAVSILPAEATATIDELAKKVVLPDGIPIKEIRRLVAASDGFKKIAYPEGLKFKTLADGRLQISRYVKVPGPSSDSGSSTSTTSTPSTVRTGASDFQKSPWTGDFACAAVTTNLNNKPMIYLYSALEGKKLSLFTVQGWFDMVVPNQTQPPYYNFVRSGPVTSQWITTDQVVMQLELNDGTKKRCTGKIWHF